MKKLKQFYLLSEVNELRGRLHLLKTERSHLPGRPESESHTCLTEIYNTDKCIPDLILCNVNLDYVTLVSNN